MELVIERPDQVWVGDITYIRLQQEFVYLAVLMDVATRAGVEGCLSQGVRAFGLRRSRYIGVAKTHLQHVITAVAMNLTRLWNWWQEIPKAQKRTSRFLALAPDL
jgi:Transposase DDE domain